MNKIIELFRGRMYTDKMIEALPICKDEILNQDAEHLYYKDKEHGLIFHRDEFYNYSSVALSGSSNYKETFQSISRNPVKLAIIIGIVTFVYMFLNPNNY